MCLEWSGTSTTAISRIGNRSLFWRASSGLVSGMQPRDRRPKGGRIDARAKCGDASSGNNLRRTVILLILLWGKKEIATRSYTIHHDNK